MSKNKRKVKSEKQANNKKKAADKKTKQVDLIEITTRLTESLTETLEQKTPPATTKKIESLSVYDDRLRDVPVGSLWMHYKAIRPGGDGGVYVITEVSLLEKTGELLVTYMAVNNMMSCVDIEKWTRPYDDFTQKVEVPAIRTTEAGSEVIEMVQVPRFRKLASGTAIKNAVEYTSKRTSHNMWPAYAFTMR